MFKESGTNRINANATHFFESNRTPMMISYTATIGKIQSTCPKDSIKLPAGVGINSNILFNPDNNK